MSSKIKIKWTKNPSSEEVLKYEVRRVDNPGTSVAWGNGIKLGDTSDGQLETTNFPYDTTFAVMIAAWDGYKWSQVDEYWEGDVEKPVVEGDVTAEAGQDISTDGYESTGSSSPGWTDSGTGSFTTSQETYDWDSESGNWTAASDRWFGTDQTQNNPDKPKYVYTLPEKDIGFGSEWAFKPEISFEYGKAQDTSWNDAEYPWGITNTKTPQLVTALSPRLRNYVLIDENTSDGPPDDDWNDDIQDELPLEMEIRYSLDGVTYSDWTSLEPGKLYFLRYYQIRFIWSPYWWRHYFTFNNLVIKVFRPNRKLVRDVTISGGSGTLDFFDRSGNPYKFLQKPTVQMTAQTTGISMAIVGWSTDANGLYDGVTVQAHDITTSSVYGSDVTVSAFIDGW